jgi:hypothetical protein
VDQDTLDEYSQAIHAVETGNERNPWQALGPRTRRGDFAVGRYQVMASQVPEWTKATLGKAMSWQQFRNDPYAQQAVFDHHFGSTATKYGNPYDAASIWFSGRPLSQGGNPSDSYHTRRQYVAGFHRALMAAQKDTKTQAKQNNDYLSQFEEDEPAQPTQTQGTTPAAAGSGEDYLSQFEQDEPEKAAPTTQTASTAAEAPASSARDTDPLKTGVEKLLSKPAVEGTLNAVLQTRKHLGGNAGLFVLGGLMGAVTQRKAPGMLKAFGGYELAHQLGIDDEIAGMLTRHIGDLVKGMQQPQSKPAEEPKF